jgi:hypothetical protein
MKKRYLAGADFRTYLGRVEKNGDLWHAVYERATIDPEVLDRARSFPDAWHLLVLSEDWCGDAVNLLPVLVRLVDEVPRLDLRVFSRDENLDLMDQHLTGGRARSIPVVLLLDEDFVERGWWGPRPEPIQRWFVDEGQGMQSKERSKTLRRYYAKDKGRTLLQELLDLMESAA